MEKERFSLLLLEPGEIYFEDFSAVMLTEDFTLHDSDGSKKLGRLKMCSKSVVFDPKDILQPVIKIPLKECSGINEWKSDILSKMAPHGSAIAIDCEQFVEMLEGNSLSPYIFKMEKRKFVFLLIYARISDCLPQINQLLRASTLPVAEQNCMIATIVYSRQSRVSFDTLWLEDLYEKVVLETYGNKITSLVINPGRILLTTSRLYFQPYNNVEPYPVLKVRLQDIKRIVRRRFILRHIGLEIYCDNSCHITHLLLSFKSPSERDTFYESLLAQSSLHLDNTEQEIMTLQWQNGVISNYDYLLYLNSLADRSFNDLTQYPVFPWVLSDYNSLILDLENPKAYRDLSLPVGALNEVRLRRLKERYLEMSHPKFLYGSHYSAPGFVLFYLVRKYPNYMLCLQNGRFDHPDRMFNSIPDIWKNVLTNMSDFKELVPAFFDIQHGGDFLVNSFGINFGYRHDGLKVGDVQLPPWAKDSQEFVNIMRNALESNYVSSNLNHWIDLIFGYKQRGREAEKADNVFYYLCYEGAIDLDLIEDINQKHALEVQIMEFGQIPKQVFTLPHPQRITGIPAMISLNPASYVASVSDSGNLFRQQFCSLSGLSVWKNLNTLSSTCSFQAHKESVSAVAIARSKQFVVSVGHDSLLKMYTLSEKRQVRSVSFSSMALSSCIILPDDKTLLVGSWDNNIVLYNLEFGRVMDSVRGHEDAVSCLEWGYKTKKLISGSWDCSVRVWQDIAVEKRIKPASALVAQLDHEARITCLSLNRENLLLVTGTEDGEMFLWNMESRSLSQPLPGHSGVVYAMSFSPDSKKFVSCGEDCTFKVLDLTTCMQVYSKTLDEELRCLSWDGLTLLLGGGLGTLYIWDLLSVQLIKQLPAHTGPVRSLAVSDDGALVVTGGEDRRVVLWEADS